MTLEVLWESLIIIAVILMGLAMLGVSIGTMMLACSLMGVRRVPGPIMALLMVLAGSFVGGIASTPASCLGAATVGTGLEWVALLASMGLSVVGAGWVYGMMLKESTGTGIGIALIQTVVSWLMGGLMLWMVFAMGWVTMGS